MEPFPKRQRLFSPIGRAFPQSFDSEEAFYDEDDFEVEEDELEVEQPDYDADSELQQKRARLDYKLKSTFEAIFEKYGKDFDGVGDEIDLATGEIVVNNGHILDMQDERDAGDISRAQSMPTEASEEPEDLPSSPLEETDELEEEEEEESEDIPSDNNMVEDDLILRGFAQANRFSRASPELGPLRKAVVPPRGHQYGPAKNAKASSKALPSRSEILAQFGPQLGPQIVEYVSKQSVPDDSHIEPAWRAPELPSMESRKREPKQSFVLAPEPERSPSPEQATSIWAPARTRGRQKGLRLDSTTNFKGESAAISKLRDLDPLKLATGLKDPDQSSRPRKKRRNFTEEDDQTLLDWVSHVRQKGLTVTDPLWRELEARHPVHNWQTWKYRYKRHFTYLVSNSVEESEASVSEKSANSIYVAPPTAPARRADAISRPNRVRKPAQKDSRIISWSEAVDALESLDPDLHAGILEDSKTTKTADLVFGHSTAISASQKYDIQPDSSAPGHPPKDVINLTNIDDDLLDSMAVEATPVREQHSIPGAPCPHADCRSYPTVLYRLQRRDEEELSEMCLHLFRVHHTTPFPCGETKCSRKGEEGYFMQADLVRHVRNVHPEMGALRRLRGRVDSELLDRNIELFTPPSDPVDVNRPVSQQRDSDFMSPSKLHGTHRPSSSQIRWSDFDPDRTPRAPPTAPGGSHSTPMTSVSSMRVHHPSATKAIGEENFVYDNSNLMDDVSLHAQRSTAGGSGSSGSKHVHVPSFPTDPSLRGNSGSYPQAGNPLPTPVTTSSSLGPPISFFDDKWTKRASTMSENAGQVAKYSSSVNTKKAVTIINETPEPLYPPQAQDTLREVPSTSFISSNLMAAPKQPRVTQPIHRNTLDPSYVFSDDEGQLETIIRVPPPTAPPTAVAKTPLTTSSMGPMSSASRNVQVGKSSIATISPTKKHRGLQSAAKSPFTTPGAQKAVRASILRMALDAEDFDELSLDHDDFVLISSQPRAKPLSQTLHSVKQEDAMDSPRALPSASVKKRKLSLFREGASPDELAEEEPSPSSSRVTAKTQIKVEDDMSLLEHQMMLPKQTSHKAAGRLQPGGLSSSQIEPSGSIQEPVHSSTPLLNLAPASQAQAISTKEIRDSAAEESSPTLPTRISCPQRASARRQREVASSSSPLAGLLTSTRSRPFRGDLLKAEHVTVVVKTPGGTLRKCGEDGFSCGRSFCFRCGSQDMSHG